MKHALAGTLQHIERVMLQVQSQRLGPERRHRLGAVLGANDARDGFAALAQRRRHAPTHITTADDEHHYSKGASQFSIRWAPADMIAAS